MFRSRQVDGILIYPVRHRELEHLRSCRRANYPIVLLIADPDAGIDGVSVNDRSGVFQATRYLIGLGHRRIGFLDATRAAGNTEKFDGYQQALVASGIAFDPDLVVATNGHYGRHGFFALDTLMSGQRSRRRSSPTMTRWRWARCTGATSTRCACRRTWRSWATTILPSPNSPPRRFRP